MNHRMAGLLVASAFVALGPQARAQSAPVLYQQALRMAQVHGDLASAIGLFQRVVTAGDRALAARALVHIGRSYERLGRPGAEGPYQRVLAVYPDQLEPVEQARARLKALGRPAGAAASPEAAAVVVRLVASGEDISMEAGLSPDGRAISLRAGDRAGGRFGNGREADLVIHDLATGARRQLTHRSAPDELPLGKSVWSPDGNRIAYPWYIGTSSVELRAIGVDGRGMTTLWSDPDVFGLWPEAWTADGRQVLTWLARRDSTWQLGLVPVAGGAATVLESFHASEKWPWGPFMAPGAGFSPDQRWIAYSIPSGHERGDLDLFVLSIDGGRRIALVDHPTDDRVQGWTSGGGILFTSDRRGTIDLFLLPMREVQPAGPPVLVKVGVGRISPLGLDRRGALYYSSEVRVSDVLTMAVDPSTWRAVGEATLEAVAVEGKSTLPDWSPDGAYFGYLSFLGAAETPTVGVRQEATGQEQRVELPIGLEPYGLWVAPGGGQVLVAGYQSGGRVLLADLANRTYTALVLSKGEQKLQAASLPPSFAWSLDGRRIFYTTLGGAQRLIVRELATGQERELYRAAAGGLLARPTASPDGRLLAFSVVDSVMYRSPVVLVLPAEGGAPRELVRRDRGLLVPIAFTPDGRHLIYALRRDQPGDQPPVVLYWVRVAGGEPELLELPDQWRTLPPGQWQNVRFRPDGRRVAFVRDRTLTEIWVLEDFTRPQRRER